MFGIETKFAEDRRLDLTKAYNNIRDQYHSSEILLQLIQYRPKEKGKILGVVEVDLFIPILTFVFGEAQLDDIASIVSLYRLNNKFYGLPDDRQLLLERLIKESIHELGHTFGLLHCCTPACVLNASTYVEDIDQKSDDFCRQCRDILVTKLRDFQSGKGLR